MDVSQNGGTPKSSKLDHFHIETYGVADPPLQDTPMILSTRFAKLHRLMALRESPLQCTHNTPAESPATGRGFLRPGRVKPNQK